MDELIGKLNTKDSILRDELDSLNVKISKIKDRSFTIEAPEQKVRKRLAYCDGIKQLVDYYEKNREFKKSLDDSEEFSAYKTIVLMYLSLQKDGGYKKDENDSFKSQLKTINQQLDNLKLSDKFKADFEDMATKIKDYRFTMFELVRVFDLIDGNKDEPAKIYSDLRRDGETEFIDKIPFAKKLLENYLDADGKNTINAGKGREYIRALSCFSTIQ